MNKYEWHLFDLDNTILDFSKTSKDAFYKTLKFCEIENTIQNYETYHRINNSYWQRYEQGKIKANELRIGRFKDFLIEINHSFDALKMSEKYLEHLILESKEISGAIEVIKKLASSSKLAIITNGLSDVQHKRISKHNLAKYFKYIFISDEMGVSKPAFEFFNHVHKIIEQPEKEKVLVHGDNPISDILGATNFGYDTLFFNYKNDSKLVKSTYQIKEWKDFQNF